MWTQDLISNRPEKLGTKFTDDRIKTFSFSHTLKQEFDPTDYSNKDLLV